MDSQQVIEGLALYPYTEGQFNEWLEAMWSTNKKLAPTASYPVDWFINWRDEKLKYATNEAGYNLGARWLGEFLERKGIPGYVPGKLPPSDTTPPIVPGSPGAGFLPNNNEGGGEEKKDNTVLYIGLAGLAIVLLMSMKKVRRKRRGK